jgi:hypothetical protein
MLLSEPDIDMYLADLEPPKLEVEEALFSRAIIAFAHMVDGVATITDLTAYRAWMTYCRMTGSPDAALAGARAVASDCALRLGVA